MKIKVNNQPASHAAMLARNFPWRTFEVVGFLALVVVFIWFDLKRDREREEWRREYQNNHRTAA